MNKTNIKLIFVLVIAFANLFLVFKLLNSDHMLDQKRNMEDVLSQKSERTLIEKGKTAVSSIKSKINSIAKIVTRDESEITIPVKMKKQAIQEELKNTPKVAKLEKKTTAKITNKEETKKVETNE